MLGEPLYKVDMSLLWRDVVGYEQYFAVSSDGQIYSKRSSKVLKTRISSTGYVSFTTRLDGRNSKSVMFRVHRLVAEAFIPNDHNKPFVNHIDGVKTNNNVDNLEWVTHSENLLHAHAIGLKVNKTGTENLLAILSKEDVSFIRENCAKYSRRSLSKKLGVSRATVDRVIHNQRYQND